MAGRLLFIPLLFLNLILASQIECNDLKFISDSLVMIDNKIYTGQCITHTKKYIIKRYFRDGLPDSIAFFDKKGKIQTVEIFSDVFSTFKSFYKNGGLKQSISLKSGQCFGFWREYYKNGKIKYEAEYVDNEELKNDSHYTWDNKGRKYLHSCVEISETKNIGKFQIDSGYRRCKKTLIKNAT